MDISGLGESGVIEIVRRFANGSGLSLNFADDVSVIPLSDEESLVLSVDQMNEDIHFRRTTISPRDLGYKALARSLSDLAAKGASPVGCLLSWALPQDLSAEWVEEFVRGFGDYSKSVPCALLGGDTGRSGHKIFISVTVIGIEKMAHLKLRSAAREGDTIAVTGTLGNSALGLAMLEGEVKSSQDFFLQCHRRPQPRLQEGQWLSRHYGVHAMMDLSDGLFVDLPRLVKSANLSARVDVSRLPYSQELKNFVKDRPARWGLYGGEDYELLLTLRPGDFQTLAIDFKKNFGLSLTAIGEVISAQAKPVEWKADFDLSQFRAFEHFKN